MTNYEEACRRVEEVISRINAAVASGHIKKEVGEIITNTYRSKLSEIEKVHHSSDEESRELRKALDAPYEGSVPARTVSSAVMMDYVTGLVGIGSECRIPDDVSELLTQN